MPRCQQFCPQLDRWPAPPGACMVRCLRPSICQQSALIRNVLCAAFALFFTLEPSTCPSAIFRYRCLAVSAQMAQRLSANRDGDESDNMDINHSPYAVGRKLVTMASQSVNVLTPQETRVVRELCGLAARSSTELSLRVQSQEGREEAYDDCLHVQTALRKVHKFELDKVEEHVSALKEIAELVESTTTERRTEEAGINEGNYSIVEGFAAKVEHSVNTAKSSPLSSEPLEHSRQNQAVAWCGVRVANRITRK